MWHAPSTVLLLPSNFLNQDTHLFRSSVFWPTTPLPFPDKSSVHLSFKGDLTPQHPHPILSTALMSDTPYSSNLSSLGLGMRDSEGIKIQDTEVNQPFLSTNRGPLFQSLYHNFSKLSSWTPSQSWRTEKCLVSPEWIDWHHLRLHVLVRDLT